MSNHEETTEYVIGRSLININEPLSPKKPILNFIHSLNQKNFGNSLNSSSTNTIDLDHSYLVESQYTPKQKHPPSEDMFLNTN